MKPLPQFLLTAAIFLVVESSTRSSFITPGIARRSRCPRPITVMDVHTVPR